MFLSVALQSPVGFIQPSPDTLAPLNLISPPWLEAALGLKIWVWRTKYKVTGMAIVKTSIIIPIKIFLFGKFIFLIFYGGPKGDVNSILIAGAVVVHSVLEQSTPGPENLIGSPAAWDFNCC